MYLGLGDQISQPSSLAHCFSPCVVGLFTETEVRFCQGLTRTFFISWKRGGGGGGDNRVSTL